MNASHLTHLAQLAAGVAARRGGDLLRVEFGELADGSVRSEAIIRQALEVRS
jgi:hypothetical protein